MMLTHCGNNVRNRYSGCVFSVKDIVPVPLKTSRNPCRQHYSPEGNELRIISRALDWEGQIFRANQKGCPACGESGMKGRVGIHELMATSEELIKGINDGLETTKIRDIARANGMSTLHQDSIMKVRDGITTMEEAIATGPPDL